MVVLDALHWIQGHEAPDLAVRWNCKAAKCGSCSAEVDGRPSLMCKTRLSDFDLERADHRRADARVPAHQRPRHRRVLELRGQQDDPAVHAARRTCPRRIGAGSRRTSSGSRSSASASSASCARTSATSCATTRPSGRSWAPATSSARPGWRCTRSTRRTAAPYLKESGGIGFCNITKCCTDVCPEHIRITDNAIIPLKERVADQYYDPLQWVARKLRGGEAGGGRGSSCRCCRPVPRRAGPTRRRPPDRRPAPTDPSATAGGAGEADA